MKITLLILSLFIVISPCARAQEEPLTLGWEELLPEGELERLNALAAEAIPTFGHFPGGDDDGSVPGQIGTFNVVEELDGKLVRVPGFVLPFVYSDSGKISEFLLVPYFGACIHMPPPPPNQMVYVKAEKPVTVGTIWDAVWVVGVLRTQKHLNDVGDAAYTLELKSWEIYE